MQETIIDRAEREYPIPLGCQITKHTPPDRAAQIREEYLELVIAALYARLDARNIPCKPRDRKLIALLDAARKLIEVSNLEVSGSDPRFCAPALDTLAAARAWAADELTRAQRVAHEVEASS